MEIGRNIEVIFVKQENSTGLHQETIYNKFMKDQFFRQDWMLSRQSPQLPPTNMNYDTFFSMK